MTRAAGQVVDYLEGNEVDGEIERRRSQPGSLAPESSGPAGVGGYFADSAERPGVWRGDGAQVFGLAGSVDSKGFLRLLQGQHPGTSEQLIGSQGSNGRAEHRSPARRSRHSSDDDLLTAVEVADLAGVDVSYIRRIASKTTRIRETQRDVQAAGDLPPGLPATFLDASKNDTGAWVVRRDEAERFAAARGEAKVVLGYDVTWSVPKSVSALYAQGSDADRVAVEESMEAAVAAGMTYLEADGFHVRRARGRETASGMVAASYRHFTNRNLEPQLHEHVVIANMATNSAGEMRSVDARGLFAHATTAGYLAAAELRSQLSRRLGLEWGLLHNGIADVAGVDREVVMAISSRRKAVLSLAEEMGYSSAAARQAAALATRPAKDRAVEAGALRESWRAVLDDSGFSAATVRDICNRQKLRRWTPADTAELFAHLGSEHGVTAHAAVFDRRHVLQATAEFAGDRLTADEIVGLGGRWLRTEAAIPLQPARSRNGETIGYGAAQVSLTPDEQRYTTPEMLTVEQNVVALHGRGIGAGSGVVDAAQIEASINASEVVLGTDQAAMVRAICGSGDQFQAVVGRAGAGKTTALRAAVDAWQAAGYEVRGAAPFGEAARNLETETGLKSTTLEGLLTRLDHADNPSAVINAKTVIVVDEASTIGNRQLDRLYTHADITGATVRTIGDPHQHQSVVAGGLWKHLTTEIVEHTPSLDINRRQTGHDMGEVRIALDEYRAGHITAAMNRLDSDNRIITATSWDELLDTMTADWFVDHQRHLNNGATVSKMIAERNSDRHALNQRAQALLRTNDVLGEPVGIGGADFHVGDRVVTQAANRDLYPNGDPRQHLVNGSQGTVTAIEGTRAAPSLVVEFDGLGHVPVPHNFIANEIGPGRGGGLAPGYAVTSYKAEGQTYDSGRNLAATHAIHTEGMYVALTRGRNDQRTYTLAPADEQTQHPELPIITDDRTAIEALTQSLNKNRGAELATVVDPFAAHRATERSRLNSLPLPELLHQRQTSQSALNPPADPRRDSLRSIVADTRDHMFDALERLDGLRHDYEAAQQRQPRQRRNDVPSQEELTRQHIKSAEVALAEATARHCSAKDALSALTGSQQNRHALSEHIAAIDRSIDERVTRAVDQQPGRYLTEVLGDRPDGTRNRLAWDSAATTIEKYRHSQLGITPDDGPLPGTGVANAIGQPPTDQPLRLRFWKHAHRQIEEHIAPVAHRDHGMERSL